jgi:hypothetical protein
MIVYDDRTHQYFSEGCPLVSVTRILRDMGKAPDLSMIPPHVLDFARQRGQAVHAACHFLDENDLEESTVDGVIKPYVEAYRRFLRETNTAIIACEQIVHHPLGWAGRLDRRCWMGPERWVLELKAVHVMAHEYTALQCVAYAEAIKAMNGHHHRIGAVHLMPGRYSLHIYNYDEYRLKWYTVFRQWRDLHDRHTGNHATR